MAEETVTITDARYQELLEAEDFLARLEAAGVDNWDGYEYAYGPTEQETKVRVSKFTKEQFTKIYNSNLSSEQKSEKLGITLAYMELKAKKLGLKKEKPKRIENDHIVIVTETGSYTRSCITFSSDAIVKAKQLREIVECNDVEFVPAEFSVEKMTEEEMEQDTFTVSKLKRNFGEPID